MNDRLTIAAMAMHTKALSMHGANAVRLSLGQAAMYDADSIGNLADEADALLAKVGEDIAADHVIEDFVERLEVADAEISRLKSELERVTAPLTDEDSLTLASNIGASPHDWKERDRAITAVKMSRAADKGDGNV